MASFYADIKLAFDHHGAHHSTFGGCAGNEKVVANARVRAIEVLHDQVVLSACHTTQRQRVELVSLNVS